MHTQESPIHSWNLIGPVVVSAVKSGAMFPRRREGMLSYGRQCVNVVRKKGVGYLLSSSPYIFEINMASSIPTSLMSTPCERKPESPI